MQPTNLHMFSFLILQPNKWFNFSELNQTVNSFYAFKLG